MSFKDLWKTGLEGGAELAYVIEKNPHDSKSGLQVGTNLELGEIFEGYEGYIETQTVFSKKQSLENKFSVGVQGDVIPDLTFDSALVLDGLEPGGKVGLKYGTEDLSTSLYYHHGMGSKRILDFSFKKKLENDLSVLLALSRETDAKKDVSPRFTSSLGLNYRSTNDSLPVDAWVQLTSVHGAASQGKSVNLEVGSIYRVTSDLQIGGRYNFKNMKTLDEENVNTNLFTLGGWWNIKPKIALSPYINYLAQTHNGVRLGGGLEAGFSPISDLYLLVGLSHNGYVNSDIFGNERNESKVYVRVTGLLDWLKGNDGF